MLTKSLIFLFLAVPWLTDGAGTGDRPVHRIGLKSLLAAGTPVRLMYDQTPTYNYGRVEVYYNGQWGTVCDDDFDDKAAGVVCGMLGFYRNNASAICCGKFGQGPGPIWLDDVTCTGTEKDIADCKHQAWGSNNCQHSEDVSVSCFAPPTTTVPVTTPIPYVPTPVRLMNGNTPSTSYGRVEVFHNGVWGSVCDDGFGDADAAVVCGMLGFNRQGSRAFCCAAAGSSSGPIWLDDVTCTGTEPDISVCSHQPWGTHNCQHSEDVAVNCSGVYTTTPAPTSPPIVTTPIRLMIGANVSNTGSGRVEVFHNGQWGSVCDDFFDFVDAQVVCRMLGYPWQNADANCCAKFGPSAGPIWLDDVTCTGRERDIANCQHSAWGSSNCQHNEDVGVTCF